MKAVAHDIDIKDPAVSVGLLEEASMVLTVPKDVMYMMCAAKRWILRAERVV